MALQGRHTQLRKEVKVRTWLFSLISLDHGSMCSNRTSLPVKERSKSAYRAFFLNLSRSGIDGAPRTPHPVKERSKSAYLAFFLNLSRSRIDVLQQDVTSS